MGKQLKQKVYDLYRKVYETTDDPSILGLAQLANVMVGAAEQCGYEEAEREIGKDVLYLFRKCCKVKKRSISVDATRLRNLLEHDEIV